MGKTIQKFGVYAHDVWVQRAVFNVDGIQFDFTSDPHEAARISHKPLADVFAKLLGGKVREVSR